MANSKWFFTRIDQMEKLAKSSENTDQLQLVIKTKNFIKEGKFTTRKHAVKVLSYWGKTDSYVASKTGLSETNIRAIRGKLSLELFQLFGSDYLDCLEAGDKKSLRYCSFRLNLIISNKNASDFFPEEYLDYIDENSELESFEILDCKEEYEFLKRYSKANFKKELSSLNPNKVAFLIRVLNKEEGSVEETYSFMKRLMEVGV